MAYMNNSIFYLLNSLAGRNPAVDQATVFIAVWLGNLLILFSVIYLLRHEDRGHEKYTSTSLKQKAKEVLLVFVSALSAWVVTAILKEIIGSPRPFDALPDVRLLFPETGFGFPSGHATFFSALAASMYHYHRKLGIAFGFAALLIGLARIVGGVHFPFDILGGFILGPIVAIAAYRILRWFGKKFHLI